MYQGSTDMITKRLRNATDKIDAMAPTPLLVMNGKKGNIPSPSSGVKDIETINRPENTSSNPSMFNPEEERPPPVTCETNLWSVNFLTHLRQAPS